MLVKDYFRFRRTHNIWVTTCCTSRLILVFIVFFSCLLACQAHAVNHNAREKVFLNLFTSEKKWLAEHSEISFGTDKGWEPFVIANRDGTISGIEADLIKRINEIAGTNIRIILSDWPKIVEKSKVREFDGLLVSTEQNQRVPYFLFTDSRLSVYKYIFSNRFKVTSLDDLQGKRVGYLRGILIHENFLKQHPKVIPVTLDGSGELATQLQNNEIDAVLGGNSIMFYLQERMIIEGYSPYIVPESR